MPVKVSALNEDANPSSDDFVLAVDNATSSSKKVTMANIVSKGGSASLALKANDSAVVHNTGAETVAGVKTFSSSPIVPTPTTDTQAATKAYVDSVGASGITAGAGLTKTGNTLDVGAGTGITVGADSVGIDSTVATLTGTQTLTNKTLTSPAITTPTGIVKGDVGLGNVDNTSDANKPISTATQTALDTHEADTTSVHGIADTSTLYRAGGTDVAVADGGTGASTASAARTNLGVQAKTFVTVGTADADYITDGVADDVEINAAITAAGGGTVHIKRGTYVLAATITLATDTVLEGEGYATKLVPTSGSALNSVTSATAGAIQIANKSRVTIRNIGIDGNNQGSNDVGIFISGSSDIRVENCHLTNMGGFGIFTGSGWVTTTDTCERVVLCNNYAYGKGVNDVFGGGKHTETSNTIDVKIYGNEIVQDCTVGTYNTALDLVGINRLLVENNNIRGNIVFGTEMTPNQFSSIIGNTVRPAINKTTCTIQVSSGAASTESSTNIVIANNVLDTIGSISVNGTNSPSFKIKNVSITGNTVKSNSTVSCIQLLYCSQVAVTGNAVDGGFSGMQLGNSDNVEVVGNVFSNCTNGVNDQTGVATINVGHNTFNSVTTKYINGNPAILAPSLTTTQRDALTASVGMVVYNTTTSRLERYEGSAWVGTIKLTGDTMTGLLTINTNTTGNTLRIAQTGTGGGIYATSTNSLATSPVISISGASTQNGAHALSVLQTSTTGTNSSALNVTSQNPEHSAMVVTGQENDRGTIKIVQNGTGGAGLSVEISTLVGATTTAAKGLFVDTTTGLTTTGNLLMLKNNNTDRAIIDADGNFRTLGYTRIGGTTAPTNITAGDLTATRLFLGSGQSVNLYESATDTLKTDDNFQALGYRANPTATTSSPIFIQVSGQSVGRFAIKGDGQMEWGDGVATRDTVIARSSANVLTFNSARLTNVATPDAGTDVANKAYVDATKQGLDLKDSVRVATTVNGALATAYANTQVVDGVTLATGDRILLKDQTAGAENGIYTVNATGAPTRAIDADVSAEVTAGMYTFVSEGTANADKGFVLTTNDPITLGTTALNFTQFSGAGQITAGAGLTKTGDTLDVIGTANRISVAADSIDIGTDVATLSGTQTFSGQKNFTAINQFNSNDTYFGTGIGNNDSSYVDIGNLGDLANVYFDARSTNLANVNFYIRPKGTGKLTVTKDTSIEGALTLTTDLAVADGGTGASTAAGARTNLGLVIGTDVQAYNANTTLLGNTTTGTGSIVLAASPTITGTLTAPNITATGTLLNTGATLTSTYLRVGSTSAPANTTAGDITASRLMMGINSAFGADRVVDIRTTPTSTAAGAAIALNMQSTFAPATNSSAQFRTLSMVANPAMATGVTLNSVQAIYTENRFGATADGLVTTAQGIHAQATTIDSSSPANINVTNSIGIQSVPLSRPSGTSTATIGTVHSFSTNTTTGAGGIITTWIDFISRTLSSSLTSVTTRIGYEYEGYNATGKSTTTNIGMRLAAPSGATNNYALQLSDTGGTAAGGVTFGSDTNLYRSAANTLKTDDTLFIADKLGAGIANGGSAYIETKSDASVQGVRVQGTNATDLGFSTFVAGDAQIRFTMRPDGQLAWGSGTAVTDTNLYRSAADTLKTDDKLIATAGIGVGNSAAATVAGTIVKKMEVFDASGVSLGFVPIYSSIT